MHARLYADNAATSFPKPPQVHAAVRDYAERLGASAGRGAYREALEAGRIVSDCRQRLARLINAQSPDRVVFTLNCTEALNLGIKGLVREGDHLVTTAMEHNSILRPVNALTTAGRARATMVPADPVTGMIDPDKLLEATRPDTRLVIVLHASNVTGTIQPVARLGDELRRRGIALLVDAAQTAGHVPIDVQAMKIDFLAVSGHKGLLGPLGTGALYIRPGLEGELRPLIEGGTGSESASPVQPNFMPDKYESGSQNCLGLAGLEAALRWIEAETVESLRAHDQILSSRFLNGLADVAGVTLYGPKKAEDRVAVFSVRLAGLDPEELSALLEAEFGILTRSGFHCAALAHESLGTREFGGTTRFSFGALNSVEDVDRCTEAIRRLAAVGSAG